LKFLDDKSITNEAAAAMEKAVKAEGLKFVLSSTDTPMSQAAGTVADKYDVCFLAEHFWANLARDHDFANTAVFFPTPEGIVSIPLKAMELHPEADRPTRLAMVTQDNADGQGMGDAIKALGPQYGFESVTPGTKDVSSVVLKLKQKDIDCLFVFSTPADGITFLKQMKDQDYSPKYVFGWMGFWTTEFMKGLGADSDYVGHDAFWSEKLPYEGAAELGQRYRDDHDGIDSVSIGQYYAGVQIMVEAIERAGVAEPQAVLAELTNATFDTIHGVIEFDAQKVADTEFLGMQWLNGERIINYPDVGTPINWFVPWKDR
jgi:branched-chain amino acid transport system substrate-binding protein